LICFCDFFVFQVFGFLHRIGEGARSCHFWRGCCEVASSVMMLEETSGAMWTAATFLFGKEKRHSDGAAFGVKARQGTYRQSPPLRPQAGKAATVARLSVQRKSKSKKDKKPQKRIRTAANYITCLPPSTPTVRGGREVHPPLLDKDRARLRKQDEPVPNSGASTSIAPRLWKQTLRPSLIAAGGN